MNIREAALSDVEPMVRLSETFRTSLASYSPTFWRKAGAYLHHHGRGSRRHLEWEDR